MRQCDSSCPKGSLLLLHHIADLLLIIYHPEFFPTREEGAANNLARGLYPVGNEMTDKINYRLCKMVDICDNAKGFVVNYSVDSGTGSNLGELMPKYIAADYRKRPKRTTADYRSASRRRGLERCLRATQCTCLLT